METRETSASVAVVIPFYNGGRWIDRALASVYGQTIPPAEVIVVNDGSKPDEAAILHALTKRYQFKVIDKPNGGQGSARNVGVAATQCEYICFLDQDDFFLPSHIEDLLSALPVKDSRLGYVYADLCEADEDGRIVCSNILRLQLEAHPKQGHISKLLATDMLVLPSASMIVRTAFNAVGGFDEQFTGYEDDDLFVRFFRANYTNYYLDKPVTVWCMNEHSTSYSIKMSTSRFKYFKKLAGDFKDIPALKKYYLRDYLIPRFGNTFISELIRAVITNNPNIEELRSIMSDYCAIVCDSPSIPSIYKLKLSFATFLFTRLPHRTARIVAFIYQLPLVRHTFRARLRRKRRNLSFQN